MTTIELISATDTITLTPAPEPGAPWVYDNVTLDAWYALPETDPKVSKRPNAHGAYSLGQVFTKEHRPIVSGQYFGGSTLEALVARNRLNALFSDGKSLIMRVTDELGESTREVWLINAANNFRHDFSHFPFDLVFVAHDPRRYGPIQTTTDGMPSSGTGLFWHLGTAPSGLYFDWGAQGNLGQVTFTNPGSASTFPRIEVGGPGSFDAGFRITEVETGRELTLNRQTNLGEIVVFNSKTQRATIGSGDVTAFLSSRDWFSIPAGATRRYQITPLGSVADSPTITLYASAADL